MLKKIKLALLRSLSRAISNSFVSRYFVRLQWSCAWSKELRFWDNWMLTKGADWPGVFEFRSAEDSKLQDHIVELIDAPAGSKVRILDVGAGPYTNLGKCWEGRKVEITAVDPLAKLYDSLLARHGMVPPIRTIICEGENLLQRFSRDSFDLVQAVNCIDHSHNPLKFIKQMVAVVKPGCFVYLHHKLNEGKKGNYRGIHQWDFSVSEGHLIVSSLHNRVDITTELDGVAEVSNSVVEVKGVFTKIRKK